MPPRVYRCYCPGRQENYPLCLILSLSIGLITLVIGLVDYRDGIVNRIVGSIFLAISLIFLLLMIHRQYRLRNTPTSRFRHLSRLLAHPQALNRFPHRAVEIIYRSACEPPHDRLHNLLKKLPKGVHILVNGPKRIDDTLPASSEIFFEPIALDESADYMDLIGHDHEKRIHDSGKGNTLSNFLKDKPTARSLPIRHILVAASTLLLFVFGIYGNNVLFIMLGIICIGQTPSIFVIRYLVPLFRSSQWWYIPGGIVNREYRFWKKRLDVKIIHAPQTVSVYDMRSKNMLILHEDRIINFTLNPIQYFAFLVAWLSTARTPSEEEIKSYLEAR